MRTVSSLGVHRERTPDRRTLDGFRDKRTHNSEQCALSGVDRDVILSNEALTMTIDSRCVAEKSDFLSMEKYIMFEIAESAEIANRART